MVVDIYLEKISQELAKAKQAKDPREKLKAIVRLRSFARRAQKCSEYALGDTDPAIDASRTNKVRKLRRH